MSGLTSILNKISDETYYEEMKPVSAEAFDNIVHNRRSVRVYTSEKIPDEVVNKALEWGLLAPNSSNLQPWAFYRIVDFSKKHALVGACLDQPAARTAPELIVAVARLNTWQQNRKQMITTLESKGLMRRSLGTYYNKIVPLAYGQGPLGVIGIGKRFITSILGLTKAIPRGPSSHADMRVWAVKTTALACENIMLGFSAQGYDTCPMEGFDSARVSKILNLDSDSEVVMVISAGKRDARGVYGPRVRFPSEQFIFTV
jgi:nitroreductase